MDQGPTRNRKVDSLLAQSTSGKGRTKAETVSLRPKQIRTDTYQRPLNEAHVKRMADDFDPILFGIPHVSIRADGEPYSVDGQHRCAAAVVAGHGDDLFTFCAHRGLTVAEEAQLFHDLNTAKPVSALSKFNSLVIAKDPTCCGIVRIVHSFGLTVSGDGRTGGISAVKALHRVYQGKPSSWRKAAPKPEVVQPGQLLSRSLHILNQAWGKERSAYEGVLIDGVAGLLNKYGATVEAVALARVLAKGGSPTLAMGKIRNFAEASGKATSAASIEFLENVYNRRKGRGPRLGDA